MDFSNLMDYTSSALDGYSMGSSIGNMLSPAANNQQDMQNFAAALNHTMQRNNRIDAAEKLAKKEKEKGKGKGKGKGKDIENPLEPTANTTAAEDPNAQVQLAPVADQAAAVAPTQIAAVANALDQHAKKQGMPQVADAQANNRIVQAQQKQPEKKKEKKGGLNWGAMLGLVGQLLS